MQVMLSDRHDFLVRAKCCGVRYYRPDDLIELFGDMPVLALESRMVRCEQCDSRDLMTIRLVHLTAEERQRAHVRQLVGVKTIKRPVWRDEPG